MLIRTFWLEYVTLGIILAITDIGVRIAQPLILGKLLEYFREDATISRNAALWFAGILVFLNAIRVFLSNHYTMEAFHCGMRVRVACCGLIYRKVNCYVLFLVLPP